MKKIAILGFAREGRSILKFLKKDKEFKNAEIWILDRSSKIETPAGIKKITGSDYLKNLEKFDIIFRTPGIPYLLPEIQKAKKSGVKISSATNLFFERCPGIIVGITGTKGKGTTSTILYQILKTAGKKVFLAGNIGKPALDILPNTDKKSIVVFELSSFQLQDIQNSPSIAAVLDIFPDHLDAHKNVNEYYEAKANIGRYQKIGDKMFFFSAKGGSASGGKNSILSQRVASKGKGEKISVNEKLFKLFSPEDLLVKGGHNFKNAVMAATIAKSLGVSAKTILKTVSKFRGNEHRLELARRIVKNGTEICFYNDSASTNPQTAAAAIEAFQNERKILIAGGQDKNLDYKPLAKALKNSGTELVVLLGENRNKIARETRKSGVKIRFARTLKDSVDVAYETAMKISCLSIVIFSPAATSFDMFENYADRGEKFKKIVMGLIQ